MNNTYLVRRSGKDEEEKDMPSFSSSSFDAVTSTTVTDAEPEDNTKAQAKESFEDALVTADGGGGSSSLSSTTLNKLLS